MLLFQICRRWRRLCSTCPLAWGGPILLINLLSVVHILWGVLYLWREEAIAIISYHVSIVIVWICGLLSALLNITWLHNLLDSRLFYTFNSTILHMDRPSELIIVHRSLLFGLLIIEPLFLLLGLCSSQDFYSWGVLLMVRWIGVRWRHPDLDFSRSVFLLNDRCLVYFWQFIFACTASLTEDSSFVEVRADAKIGLSRLDGLFFQPLEWVVLGLVFLGLRFHDDAWEAGAYVQVSVWRSKSLKHFNTRYLPFIRVILVRFAVAIIIWPRVLGIAWSLPLLLKMRHPLRRMNNVPRLRRVLNPGLNFRRWRRFISVLMYH